VVVRDSTLQAVGQGSGIFVTADGFLVTNFHVINDAQSVSVLLSNNATLFVEGVAAADKDNDLALLKVTLPPETSPCRMLVNSAWTHSGKGKDHGQETAGR